MTIGELQKIHQDYLYTNSNKTVLEVRSLFKVFPGTIALENLNLKFYYSEIHGIVGKNGAGKSTLVNILSGIIRPSNGIIIFNDKKEYKFLTPKKAKEEGIIIVTQTPEIIPDFNIVQNLFLPEYIETKIKTIKWEEMFNEARKIFEKAGFHIELTRKMSDLTLSEQQIFLLLKAFYVDNKDIVVLDEVTNSFSKKEQDFFFNLIYEQKKSGKSMIFISHRVDEVLSICDRITVMRDGKIVTTAKRDSLNKEKVCSLIIGKEGGEQPCEIFDSSFPRPELPEDAKQKKDRIILTVESYTKEGEFKNINFTLKMGEVLGLAGLVGSGRTEILKSIGGIEPGTKGWLVLENGIKRNFKNSWDAIQNGVVYLTENRDEDGLINILSVRKNLTLSYLVNFFKKPLINSKKEEKLSKELIKNFEIITASPEEEVQNLSGGNRQKVLFSRVSSTKAKVFLLDEPTKGIDISAKQVILKAIREKLKIHSGVIVTFPGIEDLLSVCDRILVLFEGEIIGEFQKDEFDELEIFQNMQGLITRKNKNLVTKT